MRISEEVRGEILYFKRKDFQQYHEILVNDEEISKTLWSLRLSLEYVDVKREMTSKKFKEQTKKNIQMEFFEKRLNWLKA